MRITERRLLDGYDGKSKGGYNISDINNSRIWWAYRKGKHYSDGGNPVCDRLSAMEITLEYERAGTLPLQARCATHPSLAKIAHDEAKMWGVEV